jgi:hypothetical protein
MVFVRSQCKWIKRKVPDKQNISLFRLASPALLGIGSSTPVREAGAVAYRLVDREEAPQLFSQRSGVKQLAAWSFSPKLDHGLRQFLPLRFFNCHLYSKFVSSATLSSVSQYLKISTLAEILPAPKALV